MSVKSSFVTSTTRLHSHGANLRMLHTTRLERLYAGLDLQDACPKEPAVMPCWSAK